MSSPMTDFDKLRAIFARGEWLTDTLTCVARPDRTYAIQINDVRWWPSREARAAALLPIALAQLSTVGTDRTAWVRVLALGTVQRVLPLLLDAFGMSNNARACREVTTLMGAADAVGRLRLDWTAFAQDRSRAGRATA